MNILLSGFGGFMGREVIKLANQNYMGANIVCGVDAFFEGEASVPCFKTFEEVNVKCDLIIDFSFHTVAPALLNYAVKNGIPTVIATTGHTEEEKTAIYNASKTIPVFYAANYSIGVSLLVNLAKITAKTMVGADIEIIEAHHNRKVDAPSGTALMIYEGIKEVLPSSFAVYGRSGASKRQPNEIGIHALRMGNVVGQHQVIVSTNNQTITLKHEAHNRALFAEGAIVAGDFLIKQGAGLYGMKDLLKD